MPAAKDKRFILAIDQGTTGTRAIVFAPDGRPVRQSYRELRQIYPRPGWVEHDPAEIWHSTVACLQEALSEPALAGSIAAIGITNQRETAVAWDRRTGQAVHNAIVWQCRRTAPACEELRRQGAAPIVQQKTGLVLDAYFSGTKWQWLLENVPAVRQKAERGEVLFGTVDSWLVWNLTGGAAHVTDWTNASRTMLFNIHTLAWEDVLLDMMGIPARALPRPVPSGSNIGFTVPLGALPGGIPICGIAGDQQAALFGQACFAPGMAKNTYGTGCFVLMHTGAQAAAPTGGLLATLAASPDGQPRYALEGSVFVAGAAIQWLRDELGLIKTAAESEALAVQAAGNNGVYLVPAFTGLGAPYWDMYARGTIVGLTRGASRAHLVRAALEAMAYQSRDVIDLMAAAAGCPLQSLRVDGGAAANNFLMQFQADILNVPVQRPQVLDTTAFGAACLAGLTAGVWPDEAALAGLWQPERTFSPAMPAGERQQLYGGWQKAVLRAKDWARP